MTQLIFRKLIIKDFKSFSGKHSFSLDRGPSLIYVAGQNKVVEDSETNGAGKTTLFDTIFWCLYGHTGRDRRPADEVIPRNGGNPRVKLFIRIGSSKHIIQRKRKPNSFTLDGEETTQDRINKLLGLSEAMFRRTIVLAQFGTLFLDLKPEAQSQMFNEALNLDVWLKASELAANKRKAYQGDIAVNSLLLMGDKGKLLGIKKSIEETKKTIAIVEKNRSINRKRFKFALANCERNLASILNKAKVESLQELQDYETYLREKCYKAETAKAEIQTNLKILKHDQALEGTKITDYTTALAGTKLCSECKQPVSTKHLKDKIKECENNIQRKQKLILEAEAALKNDQHYNKLQRKLTRIGDAVGKVLNIYYEIKSYKKSLAQVLEDNEFEPQLHKLCDYRTRLKSEIERYENIIKIANRKSARAKFWINAFKEIRLQLVDQVLFELSMASTAHVEALGLEGWRIKFATERENKSGNISIGFTTLLYSPDSNKPVKWESYSGGESQRFNLAVAFGLSEIVLAKAGVEPSFECLDEPTKGMSARGTDQLLEHLSERAKRLKKSIFLVEHHVLNRGNFDDMVTVVKDEKGSRIEGKLMRQYSKVFVETLRQNTVDENLAMIVEEQRLKIEELKAKLEHEELKTRNQTITIAQQTKRIRELEGRDKW